ncbi:MAG: ABC transporter substrate-binding protein [Dehalococcoidia bacterium]
MFGKASFWYKVAALIMVVALIVPVLAACGGGGGDETPTPTATAKPTTTPTATPIKPVSTEPIKIGMIIDFTGPGAPAGFLADGGIAFSEWYWNEKQGGINVGGVKRPVKFVKYDNAGQIGTAAAVAKKALLDGCVAVTMGGISNQFAYPIADVTDPEKVLYSTFLTDPPIYENYKWTVGSFFNQTMRVELCAKTVVEKLKPKTIGILGHNLEVDVQLMKEVQRAVKALDPDVKVVYEDYYQLGVADLAPYLTKIKYEKPDVLITLMVEGAYMNIAKQMMDLGGWGGIQHVALTSAGYFRGITKVPGAEGWLIAVDYLQGYARSSGVTVFEQFWAEKCTIDSAFSKKYSSGGTVPLGNYPVMCNPLWTAIKAIELAGTDDRAKVAEAARSGKLEFASPLGDLKIGTDGKSNLPGFFIQIKDGKAVPY